MTRKKDESIIRTPPDSLPSPEELTPVMAEIMITGTPLEESWARDVDLSGHKIPSLVARNSVFDHVSFANCRIPSFRLQDFRMVKCDLSNAVLHGFEATRVEFIGCRLTGMRASECHCHDVLFEDCDLRYVQLNDSEIRRSEFRASRLEESDLRGTDLQGAIFTNVILHRADLTQAKLRGADLRGAEIEGIAIQPKDLRGAIVSVAQAIDLARLLGVIIK